LAIGRAGQNVRLASQLIGWEINLFGSREWLERGADQALFGGNKQAEGEEFETSDVPLRELQLRPATLAALEAAGYNTLFDVIDLDRDDLLRIPAIGPEEADEVLALIDELTVEDDSDTGSSVEDEPAAAESENV
jgi:transcription termination/antitermination protein NusA